jgi:hypothetical protein
LIRVGKSTEKLVEAVRAEDIIRIMNEAACLPVLE